MVVMLQLTYSSVVPFTSCAYVHIRVTNSLQPISKAFNPTRKWGPYLPQHRKLMSLYRDPATYASNPWKVKGEEDMEMEYM